MTLEFDEERHEYRWDGRRVPNVTSIIAHLTDYSHIPPEALERARLQGVAVHKMIELHFKGTLESVPEWMKGHYAALLKCIAETGLWVLNAERRVYHRGLGYAGTLDLAGGFACLKGSKHLAIIDAKRSFYAGPAIGLQTYGYLDAFNSEEGFGVQAKERYALQLNAEGTYKLKRYDNDPKHKEDGAAFLACLQQHRWRELHYAKR